MTRMQLTGRKRRLSSGVQHSTSLPGRRSRLLTLLNSVRTGYDSIRSELMSKLDQYTVLTMQQNQDTHRHSSRNAQNKSE